MRTPQRIKEINKVKILKIVLPRTVLGDCTNITLSKVNTTKQVGTKKCFTSKRIDSLTKNCGQNNSANEKRILKSRQFKNHHNMNVDGCSNNDKKLSKDYQEPEIRPSVPLAKRLRKCVVKNYLESTLEDSTNQCTPDKSKSKVPIYRQQIPILPKSKSSDPYALDIIDPIENKRKKKKRSSAKFNKTMYNVMEKIEKKERKVTRKKKLKKMSPSYEDKIQSVMKKVLRKVHENNSVDNRSDSTPKLDTTVISNKSKMLKTNLDIEDGFQGFDNNDISMSSSNHLSLLNSFDCSARSIPSTPTISNKQINIISNISIEQTQHSTITNTANSSHVIMNTTCKDIDTNKMNTTSNILEKSTNLHREFHNDISMFNEDTLDEDCEFNLVDYVEDKDDAFFGFHDENSEEETTVQLYKKRIAPWRFQGYFRRIPYILKLKKNGLPCKQQEMVMDYEFVQRIEALCSNKSTNSSNQKSPVQTTMLKYIESTHDEPIRPSLFDYEEFNIAKTPRRALGVLQNNKVISTPTKKVQEVIMSPNVSIIASNENEENCLVKPPRKSYQKKCVQKKKNEEVLGEGALPSILETNPESPQDDVHLFEDVDNEKETDFSITLKKRRKRQISEGSDDENKPKKKKKNMMTKAEEIEFNAWADKMNKRFAEEDLHELTIE